MPAGFPLAHRAPVMRHRTVLRTCTADAGGPPMSEAAPESRLERAGALLKSACASAGMATSQYKSSQTPSWGLWRAGHCARRGLHFCGLLGSLHTSPCSSQEVPVFLTVRGHECLQGGLDHHLGQTKEVKLGYSLCAARGGVPLPSSAKRAIAQRGGEWGTCLVTPGKVWRCGATQGRSILVLMTKMSRCAT